jgi:hypothetical protein
LAEPYFVHHPYPMQQCDSQLLQRLDRILGNPAVRIAIAVRDRLRGVSAVARR